MAGVAVRNAPAASRRRWLRAAGRAVPLLALLLAAGCAALGRAGGDWRAEIWAAAPASSSRSGASPAS